MRDLGLVIALLGVCFTACGAQQATVDSATANVTPAATAQPAIRTPAPNAQSTVEITPVVPIEKAEDRPRVFVGASSAGDRWSAARNQSMEMGADFERVCPFVRISISEANIDYTVLLSHVELGWFERDNQVQVANSNGDLISKTGEGRSINRDAKWICNLIESDWYAQKAGRFVRGQGVPVDYVQAAHWYRKAADMGLARAEYSLGALYANGQGVPQDYEQAAYWYRGATEHDDPNSQYQLGILLHDGKGVEKDNAEAYFWMSVVCTTNKLNSIDQEQARIYRDQYATLLTPAVVEKQKKLVQKWLKDQQVRWMHSDDMPRKVKSVD